MAYIHSAPRAPWRSDRPNNLSRRVHGAAAGALEPSRGIALLRLALGLEFLLWSWDKLQTGWITGGQALSNAVGAASDRAPGPYADFLAEAVLPNSGIFAQLVTLGELGAGVSLTLGLFTRLGAATGMLLVLNFMLMRGVGGVEASIDRIFFVACAICLLTGAGRVWGMDGPLRRSLSDSETSLRFVGWARMRLPGVLLRFAQKLQ